MSPKILTRFIISSPYLALVFDDTGSPRFLDEIIGVTRDQGFIEFIVKYKYMRQERLVHGDNLKERVPQHVISFYERHVKFGTETKQHFIIDSVLI